MSKHAQKSSYESEIEQSTRENLIASGFKPDQIFAQREGPRRIKSCLKNASKNGAGPGIPEFVVDCPDFLIVIECKSTKHSSIL